MIKYVYREDGVIKTKTFPYKYKGKGIDYKQLDAYYEFSNKNRHTDWLGLFIIRTPK